MSRIKQICQMAKVYNIFDSIYVFIPVLFVTSVVYNFGNTKYEIISFLPMFFTIMTFMVGFMIELRMSARYNVLTSVPYKAENIIKDIFFFTEIFVLSVFIFDVIINFCFGNIDVALAHLATCFFSLFFNYTIITFASENQMKTLNVMTKRVIGIFICTLVWTLISLTITILPVDFAGNTILRYIYLAVSIVFALCDIIFRKAFINKTIKKIRG